MGETLKCVTASRWCFRSDGTLHFPLPTPRRARYSVGKRKWGRLMSWQGGFQTLLGSHDAYRSVCLNFVKAPEGVSAADQSSNSRESVCSLSPSRGLSLVLVLVLD